VIFVFFVAKLQDMLVAHMSISTSADISSNRISDTGLEQLRKQQLEFLHASAHLILVKKFFLSA
jgi:hypothetical protein